MKWLVVSVVALVALVATAQTQVTVTEYRPTRPGSFSASGIAAGPDGNLWLTELGTKAHARLGVP